MMMTCSVNLQSEIKREVIEIKKKIEKERNLETKIKKEVIEIKKTEENSAKTNERKSITNDDDGDDVFHAIILDGTWHHAESIFYRNLDLQKLKQVIN